MVRMVSRSLEIRYDSEADAAYIYVVNPGPGPVQILARTKFCDAGLEGSSVILGFDDANGLVGIEILGASKVLPAVLLTEPEPG